MIVWINGAFGAGKSTLAAGLHTALSQSVLADPEDRSHRRRRTPDYEHAATAWLHTVAHVIDTSTLTPGQTLQAALAHLFHTST
ncbi:hypothetical protein ACFWUZ_02530 [Streptomyces sp. NPDC058646]|uniref:hypothetical protein n=1 Tax=Streptomyces TaxID=1883 RepID=UPI003657944B